jgi:hypothetical protein
VKFIWEVDGHDKLDEHRVEIGDTNTHMHMIPIVLVGWKYQLDRVKLRDLAVEFSSKRSPNQR